MTFLIKHPNNEVSEVVADSLHFSEAGDLSLEKKASTSNIGGVLHSSPHMALRYSKHLWSSVEIINQPAP